MVWYELQILCTGMVYMAGTRLRDLAFLLFLGHRAEFTQPKANLFSYFCTYI